MSQKFMVVYAYTTQRKRVQDKDVALGYGFCFIKRDKPLEVISAARERSKKNSGELVGAWSIEWNNPKADYKLVYCDPHLPEAKRGRPVGEFAEMMRSTTKKYERQDKVVDLKPKIKAKPTEDTPPYRMFHTYAATREE